MHHHDTSFADLNGRDAACPVAPPADAASASPEARRPFAVPRLLRHEDLPEATGGGLSGVGASGESF